jgi:hypothetical protein
MICNLCGNENTLQEVVIMQCNKRYARVEDNDLTILISLPYDYEKYCEDHPTFNPHVLCWFSNAYLHLSEDLKSIKSALKTVGGLLK